MEAEISSRISHETGSDNLNNCIANAAASIMGRRRVYTFSDGHLKDNNNSSSKNQTDSEDSGINKRLTNQDSVEDGKIQIASIT